MRTPTVVDQRLVPLYCITEQLFIDALRANGRVLGCGNYKILLTYSAYVTYAIRCVNILLVIDNYKFNYIRKIYYRLLTGFAKIGTRSLRS